MNSDNELLVWIKDGNLRTEILRLLFTKEYLPSEISRKLNKHRASISRTLNLMEAKGIIRHINAGSRTKLYQITDRGKIIKRLVNS